VVSSGSTAARASTTTRRQPERLGLVMTATPDPVAHLGLVTYALTVTNRGTVDAEQVDLRMTVPSGTYDCYGISDDATCSFIDGRDLVWALDTLTAGTSRTVHVVLASDLPTGSILSAQARVEDAAGSRMRAEIGTAIETVAPLGLALTTGEDAAPVDGEIEYVLRYGNDGTEALLGTQMVLTLPPGTTLVDAGGGTEGTGTVAWALGTLQAAQTGERRVRVRVDDLGASDPLVRVARAVLSSGTAAARASAVTRIQTLPTLGLVMTATPDPVARLGLLTYELTVTNRGSEDAVQVELRMTVPTGTYDCYEASDGATCSFLDGRDIVWSLGTMAAGTSRTVHVVLASDLATGSVLSADARVQDAAGTRVRAAISTAVQTGTPLSLALTESADPVLAGDDLDYVLRFGNGGPTALLNTHLVLTLPLGVTVLDAAGGTVANQTIMWNLATLGAGATGERRVQLHVDDLGDAEPFVRVARALLSSGAANAQAEAVTAVEGTTLELVMEATPDPVVQLGQLTYRLTVTNHDSDDAVQVTLRMAIPVGTYNCGAVSVPGTYARGCRQGSDVVWALGTLAQNESRQVQVILVPGALPSGSIFTAKAQVENVAGTRTRAAVSTVVIKP